MKVLLVDDDVVINFTYKKIIEKILPDTQVLMAQNGIEALDVLGHSGLPDLILLDMEMPGMDGLTFLEVVKNLKLIEGTSTKIVMLTGSENEEHRYRALALGASDFILKPISSDRLRQLLL